MRKAIREDRLKVGNLELIVCVLDDGTRVIEQESLIKFFEGLGSSNASPEEIEQLVLKLAGKQ